jgi:hypothetical protein
LPAASTSTVVVLPGDVPGAAPGAGVLLGNAVGAVDSCGIAAYGGASGVGAVETAGEVIVGGAAPASPVTA